MSGPEEPEPAEQLATVEAATSPSSAYVMSRFEFEKGAKGNEGTKILMVEWDPRAATSGDAAEKPGPQSGEGPAVNSQTEQDQEAEWEFSWEGKTTVLPIRDNDADASSNGEKTRRVYFLLPPGAAVPPLVTISIKDGEPLLRTKPLPAIFTPGLVSDPAADEATGRRGVLHTIWAKKRLSQLDAEIAAEARTNGEGVALEMAVQERQWITDHFGLGPARSSEVTPLKLRIPGPGEGQDGAPALSPRTPGGGRLAEKLRGLKLATSPVDLAAASQAAQNTRAKSNFSLSPTPSDVAVSSFASFGGKGAAPRGAAAGTGVIGSLDAIVGSVPVVAAAAPSSAIDTEDELFALPMSPRSPEMAKSPFSLLRG